MRPDERHVQRSEKRMANRLLRSFAKQRDYVIAEAANLYPNQSIYSRNELDSRRRTIIEQIILDMPEVDAIIDNVIYFRSITYARQAKRIIKDMKLTQFGVSFDSVNARAVKRLAERKAFELSQRAGTISSTTNQRIKEILLDGIQSGESYQSLSQRIQALSKEGVFSQARGELISTTEIGKAYGEGNWDVLDEFKSKNPNRQPVKRWVTVRDDRVRDDHTRNQEDGWIPMERAHSGTGEMYAPSSDYRCRCFERYSIDAALVD
jgi:uncharacterized protein with gpF-like domain